jgi:ATP-dependent Lon protease
LRGGLTTVFIPKDNEKDLAEIPDNVKKKLEIVPVARVEELLARALTKPLVPIEWDEEEEEKLRRKPSSEDEDRGGVVH